MTNKGTAKRTNIRWVEKDESGESAPEPKPPTIVERTASHRDRHPNDLISFGEEPITRKVKPPFRKAPKPFSSKDKGIMFAAIKNGDKEHLSKCSRKRLMHLANDRMSVLREAAGIETPLLPLDGNAEPILYPSGRGRGKIGIVEWLLKYDERYQEMNTRLILDKDMKQTLM